MQRTRVSVEEGYERWAPTYDRDPNPLRTLEERQLKFMIPSPEGKRVLDLACGTGRWLSWLINARARVGVGVDISAAMLAAADKKSEVRGHVVRAECSAVPFPDATFDLVVCSFAVGHIAHLPSIALEVARVVTPAADVFVSDLHPLAYAQGWRTGFRDHLGPAEIVIWPRSETELMAPWTSAGFNCARVVECRFSESERHEFLRAGKGDLFEKYRIVPSILICHFTRTVRRPSDLPRW